MRLECEHVLASLPKSLRILRVTKGVLFPRGVLTPLLREPRDLELVDDALEGDRLIGVVLSREDPCAGSEPAHYQTGCLGRIKQFTDEENGSYRIGLRGLLRFGITKELRAATLYGQCQVDFAPFIGDLWTQDEERTVDREAVLTTLDRFISACPQRIDWDAIYEASNEILLNGLAIQGPFSRAEKQALLEAQDLKSRAELLVSLLEFEVAKHPRT